MATVPLHPALVHVPLGLAVAMPVLAVAVLVLIWRGNLTRAAWWLVAGMQLVLCLGALAAYLAGDEEGEALEHTSLAPAIERHEHAAEIFALTEAGALVVAGAALFTKNRSAEWLSWLSVAGMVGGLGLAYRAGKLGGELVFEHGARTTVQPAPASQPKGDDP